MKSYDIKLISGVFEYTFNFLWRADTDTWNLSMDYMRRLGWENGEFWSQLVEMNGARCDTQGDEWRIYDFPYHLEEYFRAREKPGKKLFLEKDDLRQEAVLLNASQPNYHEGAVLYGFLDGRTRGLLYFKAKTGSLALDWKYLLWPRLTVGSH